MTLSLQNYSPYEVQDLSKPSEVGLPSGSFTSVLQVAPTPSVHLEKVPESRVGLSEATALQRWSSLGLPVSHLCGKVSACLQARKVLRATESGVQLPHSLLSVSALHRTINAEALSEQASRFIQIAA